MPSHDPSQLQLAPRHLALLQAVLAAQAPDAEVWAYGSRVNGVAQECSDLDLVLRNPDDPSLGNTAWAAVKESLQQSPLPILVDVQDWANLPQSFQRSIERGYVVVQHPRHDRGNSPG